RTTPREGDVRRGASRRAQPPGGLGAKRDRAPAPIALAGTRALPARGDHRLDLARHEAVAHVEGGLEAVDRHELGAPLRALVEARGDAEDGRRVGAERAALALLVMGEHPADRLAQERADGG